MKILSLNIEGKRHIEKALAHIMTENPDILCLAEAPGEFQLALHGLGYQTTFAPMTLQEQDGETFPEGVLFATHLPHHAEAVYYHGTGTKLRTQDRNDIHSTIDRVVIIGTVADMTIATTHFTWNPRGEVADEHQITHLDTLLTILKKLPPHILCGDFNLPRRQNKLYDVVCNDYTDTIPQHYTSSLDRTLHCHGSNPDSQMLFDSFMVDYMFTKPPYVATDVHLTFGVSDHASVVASISKE